MSLISPNFDVKSIIFPQFWPGAFSQNCSKKPWLDCGLCPTKRTLGLYGLKMEHLE